jgi:hypothetical protein
VHQRLLKKSSRVGLIASALWLAACGGPAYEESLTVERAPVVYGQRSTSADDTVVSITTKPPGSTPTACSGVLVAPNVVLTAIHCVAQFTGGTFGCNSDGTISPSKPGDGALGELASPDQVVIRVGVNPTSTEIDALGMKVFGTGTNQICRNDFAIVVLDRDLALPLSSLRLARGVELGEAMRVVGYGATEMSGTSGRFERDRLHVTDRGQDAGGATGSNAAPRTLVVGEGPCHGDSGGPIFSDETGAVVGVYSLADGPSCTALGVRNTYTRLAPFADLIQSAFEFAGHTPILEPGDDAAGNAGAGGASSDASGGSSDADSGLGGSVTTASGGSHTLRPGGSGSSQDGCACRVGGLATHPSISLSPLLALLALLARRRRATR